MLIAAAQDSRRSSQVDAIKAAFIRHFISYTQWPADRFADENSPIVIAVVGDHDFLPILRYDASRVRLHGRSLTVRQYSYPAADEDFAKNVAALYEQLRKAHLLFIAPSERTRVRGILQGVRSSDVLTASDMPQFCEQGGMLGLTVREGRMAIDANPSEIQRTRLTVSSKLLRLARVVETEPE